MFYSNQKCFVCRIAVGHKKARELQTPDEKQEKKFQTSFSFFALLIFFARLEVFLIESFADPDVYLIDSSLERVWKCCSLDLR